MRFTQETRHHRFEEGDVQWLVRTGIELEDQIVKREDRSDSTQSWEQMFRRVKNLGIAKHAIHAKAGEVGQCGRKPPGTHGQARGPARQLIEGRLETRL